MTPADPSSDDVALPLVEHLTELRDRLLRCLLAVLLIFLALYPFANDIYAFVSEPLRQLLPQGATMIATDVTSPFLTPFKLTLVLAVFVAVPFLLYQAWAFVAPGMYRNEKRFAIPLLASSVLLFYLGIAFAYFVVFPLVFGFFTSIGPSEMTVMTDINSYLNFILKMFFAFGVAFEIPIATLLMVWSGMVSAESLASKRRYILVGCFIVGMLLTPPDVISQALLALPMWLLFEAGLFLSRWVQQKDDAGEQQSTADNG